MLRNFTLLLFILFATTQLSTSQTSPAGSSTKQTITSDISAQNLKTYQAAFEAYMDEHEDKNEDIKGNPETEEEADGYNQFKRWEWIMQSRTFPTGNLPDPGIAARERSNYLKSHPNENTSRTATWAPVGTADVPSDGGGAGRINVIRFHPEDPDIIYIGAAGGGVWKTTDGGITWMALGDQLPVTSIADLAINPLNPDEMYVATGDGYGYEATWLPDQDFWGGVYAAGILKSTNGGNSWEPTGLSFEQENLEIVQRMIIHPSNPDILLAATRNGIFRTTDAGATWLLVEATHCYDMAFNTSNSDIVYAAGNKDILRSTDAGATWSILKDNLGGEGQISFETTAADPDIIYALFESGQMLYRSTNSGVNWSTMQSPGSAASFYGYYDMAFTVSPADADVLFAGGLLVAKSTNGGSSWQAVSDWDSYPDADYVHADNHALAFDPSGANIYSGNDGGLFKSANLGGAWTDLSNGMSLAQIYRLSSSVTNPDINYSGWQDNGSNRWNGTTWKQVYGADGMQPLVDYTDENIVYICYQYGGLNKSIDGGETFEPCAPSGGGWVTPYTIDPQNHNILYYGGNSVYKTTNGANSWTQVGNLFNSLPCNAIAIAPSNTSYVYAASLDKMFVSSTAGNPWTEITAGLPVTQSGINYIAIDNTDPLNVWVAISGYVEGNKVFHSSNGGNSWTNVSGTLPNVPVNCIVYEADSQDGLYIGTDVGVFYIDNTLTDWVSYNAGLPNVMVHHMEINPTSGKLLAATYGRGIWESDLYYTVQYANDIGAFSVIEPSNVVCASSVDPEVKVKNFGTNTVTSFEIQYSIDGGDNFSYLWSGSLAPESFVTITLPTITGVSEGSHTFEAFTSLPNGISDNNTANDDDGSSFSVIGAGISLPLAEGFESGVFPPDGWTMENDNLLWSATDLAGGFGNSVFSARSNFYSVLAGSVDEFTTPYLNFTNSVPPVKLKFTYAYAKKNIVKTDTLKIGVSVDCGATFTSVFVKGGEELATAPDVINPAFIPDINEWKDEIIDLGSYASYDKVLIRFQAVSDKGNNLYVDDINLYGLSTAINDLTIDNQMVVYPNPTSGDFTIALTGTSPTGVTIELFNTMGQKVDAVITKTNKPVSTYQLQMKAAENGWYLVKVKTKDQTFVQPLMLHL